MNISVIGTGYVGLVAGTCFSENGHEVICVDINERRIHELQQGKLPFYEPGLEELTKRNIKNERLLFTTNTSEAIKKTNILFIAVGTPTLEDGSSDLKHVLKVAHIIAENMNEPKIIVVKSTVPVGSSKKIEALIREKTSIPFSIISNPEFLKEGAAVLDFLNPERIVIGGRNSRSIKIMKELYAPFIRSGNPILVMDNESAELSKYACNAYLAMRISFINEIANFCGDIGANIDDVRKVLMTDTRIGKKFLYPGTGYGGSCFPKDVRTLIHTSSHHRSPSKILKSVEAVNNEQKEILFHKAFTYFKGAIQRKTVAIWGLSFKPNTDDIREAPSLTVIQKFLDHDVMVHVYDPLAISNTRAYFEDRIKYFNDSYECLKGTDALFIFTEWNEFRKPNFALMKSLLKNPLVFDGRNLFSVKEMKKLGFIYYGIGIGHS